MRRLLILLVAFTVSCSAAIGAPTRAASTVWGYDATFNHAGLPEEQIDILDSHGEVVVATDGAFRISVPAGEDRAWIVCRAHGGAPLDKSKGQTWAYLANKGGSSSGELAAWGGAWEPATQRWRLAPMEMIPNINPGVPPVFASRVTLKEWPDAQGDFYFSFIVWGPGAYMDVAAPISFLLNDPSW